MLSSLWEEVGFDILCDPAVETYMGDPSGKMPSLEACQNSCFNAVSKIKARVLQCFLAPDHGKPRVLRCSLGPGNGKPRVLHGFLGRPFCEVNLISIFLI